MQPVRLVVQFNIAKTIPGKEEFYETLRYFKRKIELQPNIKLVLNHTATYEGTER